MIYEVDVSSRVSWTRVKRPLFGIVAFLSLLVGFSVWAVSSPVGASPDDDYHLGSIWCPSPKADSDCVYSVVDGTVTTVRVPESVLESRTCYAYKPNVDASCTDQFSDGKEVGSLRFNRGGYPGGYYSFQHMLVGDDVSRSVVIMRLSNIVLSLGLTAIVVVMASPRIRQQIVLSATVAWVPMGVYFISSTNPSAWAISGCYVYGAALVALIFASGRKTWILLGTAAVGALMAIESRTDSAFFVVVISLAVALLAGLNKAYWRRYIVLAFVQVFAVTVFLSTGQTAEMTSAADWPVSTLPLYKVFFHNLLKLPEYLGKFWGLNEGMGWLDVSLLGWSTLTMIALAGGLFAVGLREVWTRKALSILVLAGAIGGIPVLGMTIRRVEPVTLYQGRYMLPLVAILFLVLLVSRGKESLVFSRSQLVVLLAVVTISNGLALRRLIRRYAIGLASSSDISLSNPTWSPWPISAEALWWIGTVGLTLGVTLALVMTSRTTIANPEIAEGLPQNNTDEGHRGKHRSGCFVSSVTNSSRTCDNDGVSTLVSES